LKQSSNHISELVFDLKLYLNHRRVFPLRMRGWLAFFVWPQNLPAPLGTQQWPRGRGSLVELFATRSALEPQKPDLEVTPCPLVGLYILNLLFQRPRAALYL